MLFFYIGWSIQTALHHVRCHQMPSDGDIFSSAAKQFPVRCWLTCRIFARNRTSFEQLPQTKDISLVFYLLQLVSPLFFSLQIFPREESSFDKFSNYVKTVVENRWLLFGNGSPLYPWNCSPHFFISWDFYSSSSNGMTEDSQDSTIFPQLIVALGSSSAALLHRLATKSFEIIKFTFSFHKSKWISKFFHNLNYLFVK